MSRPGSTVVTVDSPVRVVEIVPYDPAWPGLFGIERHLLADALPGALGIEHIGSTSVPGLAAKPIVDILVVVPEAGGRPCRALVVALSAIAPYPQNRHLAHAQPGPPPLLATGPADAHEVGPVTAGRIGSAVAAFRGAC